MYRILYLQDHRVSLLVIVLVVVVLVVMDAFDRLRPTETADLAVKVRSAKTSVEGGPYLKPISAFIEASLEPMVFADDLPPTIGLS